MMRLNFMRPPMFASRIVSVLLAIGATGSTKLAAAPLLPQPPGLQLYSLRAQLASDPAGALNLIRSWGVTEVETAGIPKIPAAELADMLHTRGLKAVSAHFQYARLEKDLDATVADARSLGVRYALCPSIPHPAGAVFDADAARTVAAKFNLWGAAFKAAGIQFAYHTHGFEFTPSGQEGETVFDVLVRATDPALVKLEMDVFWVFVPGIDPVSLLEKYPDRWVMLHLKDLRRGAKRGGAARDTPATDRVAVGAGQIDWPAVIRAAQRIGVKYYFIEDEGVAPLADIPASIAYLRAP